MAVRAGGDRALCNVKVSLQMEQLVWSGSQRVKGRLAKEYMSEDNVQKLSKLKKELMALGMYLPVLRCKNPKYYAVWYDPYGWVSKKRLQKPRKAFRSGIDDVLWRLSRIWKTKVASMTEVERQEHT